MNVNLPSQSRLFTSTAWCSPGPKSMKRSSCALMHSALCAIVSTVCSWRSLVLPEGSPMSPVAPPTSARTRWPARW